MYFCCTRVVFLSAFLRLPRRLGKQKARYQGLGFRARGLGFVEPMWLRISMPHRRDDSEGTLKQNPKPLNP